MKKSELKQLIRETIDDVKLEAKTKTSTSGTAYTFNQLNRLMEVDKIIVFIKPTRGGKLVQIPNDEGFFDAENDDGEETVHTGDFGNTLYEFGYDFKEIYVAQKVNIK
jgi:hypothetical protein